MPVLGWAVGVELTLDHSVPSTDHKEAGCLWFVLINSSLTYRTMLHHTSLFAATLD